MTVTITEAWYGFVTDVYDDAMCGRFLSPDGEELEGEFPLSVIPTEQHALLTPGAGFRIAVDESPLVVRMLQPLERTPAEVAVIKARAAAEAVEMQAWID